MCRRCGTLLAQGRDTYIAKVTGAEKSSGLVPMKICPVCDWANVSPSHAFVDRIELRKLLRSAPELLHGLSTAASSFYARALLRHLRARIVARVFEEVRASPDVALAILMNMLAELFEREQATEFGDKFPAYIQQIYVLLRCLGPLSVFSKAIDAVVPSAFWTTAALPLLEACRVLSKVIEQPEDPVRLESDVLVVESQPLGPWQHEINANIYRQTSTRQSTKQLMAETTIEQAEREVFGYSVSDFLALFRNRQALSRFARTTGDGEVVIVDLGSDTEPIVKMMARDFTLTPHRMQTCLFPAFFSSAAQPADRSMQEAIEEINEADWLLHVPLMEARYWHRGQEVPAGVTSGYLLHRVQGRAASSIAYRFRNAQMSAEALDAEAQAHVAKLARRFSSEAELGATAEWQQAGMSAVAQVERVGNKVPSCGEIDVLAAGAGTQERTIVAVCEVKNTDMVFYKDFGGKQLWNLLLQASSQARRKAEWVLVHWKEVSNLFGDVAVSQEPPIVVAIVVTRATPQPIGEGRCVFIAAAEIRSAAASLLTGDVASWRPDFRAAIVGNPNDLA